MLQLNVTGLEAGLWRVVVKVEVVVWYHHYHEDGTLATINEVLVASTPYEESDGVGPVIDQDAGVVARV